jgi:uncharacterized protein YdeI (YjbR/CyaY-like superfamily)
MSTTQAISKSSDIEIDTYCPTSAEDWRQWLLRNHDAKQSVWLVYYKKNAKKPTVTYSDAVDEALCFGWIDSRAKPLDDEKFMQFFSRRKPTSVWSKVNKTKIKRLVEEGKMTQAGFDSIERAKQNGSWTILDEVEELIVPSDLNAKLEEYPRAMEFFLKLSRTDKRNILQWLVLAKRPETRSKRIKEIVELADQHLKPKQFRGKPKKSE